MQTFVISSDSTCDLYSDYVVQNEIAVVPLRYTMDKDGSLTEHEDSFTEYSQYVDFYAQLRAGGFSRTSMLNHEAHFSHFEKLIAAGAKEIVHVSLSGGLSPTANVAAQAAAEAEQKHPGCKIYLLNTTLCP